MRSCNSWKEFPFIESLGYNFISCLWRCKKFAALIQPLSITGLHLFGSLTSNFIHDLWLNFEIPPFITFTDIAWLIFSRQNIIKVSLKPFPYWRHYTAESSLRSGNILVLDTRRRERPLLSGRKGFKFWQNRYNNKTLVL